MKPSTKTLSERYIAELEKLYPEAICSLHHGGDPWKLVIMARLSAQCTDERVNIVCEELFTVFPNARALADGEISEIERIIRSCGLFHTKAVSIKEASRMICEEFGGRIPDTMEELLSLPGVGRKVANLVLGDLYGQGGIVADTHFMRISGRIGFYEEGMKEPLKVERIMDKIIPRDKQTDLCHRAVLFGRDICTARSPKCTMCPLRDVCQSEWNK